MERRGPQQHKRGAAAMPDSDPVSRSSPRREGSRDEPHNAQSQIDNSADASSAESETEEAEQLSIALLFDWDFDQVMRFVDRVHAMGDDDAAPPPPPHWLRTPPSRMTSASFTDDMMTFLARVAGNRTGNILFTPNTPAQALAVMFLLGQIHASPFVQMGMRDAAPSDRLADVAFMLGSDHIALPIAFAPVAPSERQVFGTAATVLNQP